MNQERLLRLAEHLDTVNEKQFDMSNWARQSNCGTVCCACGHACNLFLPNSYPRDYTSVTPAMVAARIRDLVANQKKAEANL